MKAAEKYGRFSESADGSGKTCPVVSFPSYSAFLECAGVNSGHANNAWANSSYGGVPSVDAALELARLGWSEGYHKIIEAKRMLDTYLFDYRNKITKKKIRQFHAAEGDEVDINRYNSGAEEHMLLTRRQAVKKYTRVINLPVCINNQNGTPDHFILNRGAAIVAAIELLEVAGNQVELFAIMGNGASRSNDIALTAWPVKRAGERMDLNAMAFLFLHPASPRRLGYSVKENWPGATGRRFGYYGGGNYGHAFSKIPQESYTRAGIIDPCTMFEERITGLHTMFNTLPSAAEWVKAQLEKHLKD